MNIKLLFFLRAYNDIDHIVPIIYKCLTTLSCPISVIITTEKKFMNDFRINYLKQFKNFLLQHISEFQNAASLFDSQLSEFDRAVVAFDWTYTDNDLSLAIEAKKRGAITVSLPHGGGTFVNSILHTLNYNNLDHSDKRIVYDYSILPHRIMVERLLKVYDYNMSKRINRIDYNKKLKVLGSPRYNDEWLKIIQSLTPEYDFLKQNKAKLKIVLFLRNFNYPIFWEEVIRAIKLIIQFPEVYLIIKHHTRSATVDKLIKKYPQLNSCKDNVRTVYDDVHSASLLKWADVLVDMGTSVSFEAVINKIPILCLEYLHPNRSIVPYYIKACEMRCRDDLYDNIVLFIKDKKHKFYDDQERERFIKEVVYGCGNAHVLERYVNFFKDCITKSSVNFKSVTTKDKQIIEEIKSKRINNLKSLCELEGKEFSPGNKDTCLSVDQINKYGEKIYLQGDKEEAMNYFKLALEIDPMCAIAHNNIGVIYWGMNIIDKALQHFHRAYTIDSLNRSVVLNFGGALKDQNRLSEVIQLYSLYLTKRPNDKQVIDKFNELSKNLKSKDNLA